MGKNDKAAAPVAEKKKRTVLTDAERLAKMEAELRAAREKAQTKATAKITKLEEQVKALVKKRDALNDQIGQLTSEVNSLKELAGEEPRTAEDEAPAAS